MTSYNMQQQAGTKPISQTTNLSQNSHLLQDSSIKTTELYNPAKTWKNQTNQTRKIKQNKDMKESLTGQPIQHCEWGSHSAGM